MKILLSCFLALGLSANAQTYCAAGSESQYDESISNVTFADINNDSTSDAPTPVYEDFTSITGHVNAGQTYSFSADYNGFSWSDDQIIVWVDFNQDGDFDDAGEQVLMTNPHAAPWTGSITIPTLVSAGNTRMRVRLQSSTLSPNSTPCGNSLIGQVEDYTLNIAAAPPCTGTPDAGTATASVVNACLGVPFTLTSDVAPATGYSYQWQYSNDGGTTWQSLGTAQTTVTYTVASQTVATDYRLVVTCANGGAQSAPSNVVTVNQNAPTECYCAAGASHGDNESISNVTFANINNNSTSTNGYEDFTSIIGNVTQGQSYSFSATSEVAYVNDQIIVWIDFNQNGSFDDPGEQVFVSDTSGNTPWTSVITIPVSALAGNTRMRVRLHYDDEEYGYGNSTPCGDALFGQVEDYTLNIGQLAVSEVSKSNVNAYPNPIKDIFKIEAKENIKFVKISDTSGKQLMIKEVNSAKLQIDFSKFTSGVYIVTTILEDGTSTSTKVIKQ